MAGRAAVREVRLAGGAQRIFASRLRNPVGLAWAGGTSLPARFTESMFVGQQGSWNRQPKSGYKVIFVPFAAGRPSGPAEDVPGGFPGPDEKARGRPVGVALDRTGALLVADDVGNVVWRVSAAPAGAALP